MNMSSDTMSDAACGDAEAIQDGERPRGRIPKGHWAYVRGLYEVKGLTFKEIGDEYGCTPSAVFYVVKQAQRQDLEPTLDMPTQEASNEINRIMRQAKATDGWAKSKVHQVIAKPAQPSQVELMAQQANDMLQDEKARRLFDASSETILGYVGFMSEPTEANRQRAKDSLHSLRRAVAGLELAIETKPLQQPKAETAFDEQSVRPLMPEVA